MRLTFAPAFDQHLDDREIAALDRHHQRRLIVRVRGIHLRPGVKQHLDQPSSLDCRAASVSGVAPNSLTAFGFAFFAIKRLRDFILRAIDRPHQRTGPVSLRLIDVRPGLNLSSASLVAPA